MDFRERAIKMLRGSIDSRRKALKSEIRSIKHELKMIEIFECKIAQWKNPDFVHVSPVILIVQSRSLLTSDYRPEFVKQQIKAYRWDIKLSRERIATHWDWIKLLLKEKSDAIRKLQSL